MYMLHSEPVDINLNTPIMSVKSKPHEILYYSCLLDNYYKKYYIRMQNYNKFVEYMYNLRSNLKYIDVKFQKIVDPEIGEYAYILPRIPDKYKKSCNFDNITIIAAESHDFSRGMNASTPTHKPYLLSTHIII